MMSLVIVQMEKNMEFFEIWMATTFYPPRNKHIYKASFWNSYQMHLSV